MQVTWLLATARELPLQRQIKFAGLLPDLCLRPHKKIGNFFNGSLEDSALLQVRDVRGRPLGASFFLFHG
jgi:hypothetical protein